VDIQYFLLDYIIAVHYRTAGHMGSERGVFSSYFVHPVICSLQASREPLSADAMGEIFENIKDMGVLIGKGGVYGQVKS